MQPAFLCVLILKCEAPGSVAAWYRDVLGIPLEERGHEFSCMSGRMHFSIHGLLEGQSATRDAELGFHFSDLDGLVGRLAAKNIALADPIREYPWARAAQIKDPLGNMIYLMQLPAATLDSLRHEL